MAGVKKRKVFKCMSQRRPSQVESKQTLRNPRGRLPNSSHGAGRFWTTIPNTESAYIHLPLRAYHQRKFFERH